MEVRYIKSDSRTAQGKRDKIYKEFSKEWNIQALGKGNGNWLLTKNSDVLVDGKSCRSFVLEYYGESKLTEELVDRFREDLTNGIITLAMLFRS